MNIHFHRATPGGIADEAALEQFQKSGRCFTTRSRPSICHSLSSTSLAAMLAK
jgi:hypothetical protein